MAVSFIARKCACGGKLEFDPQKRFGYVNTVELL